MNTYDFKTLREAMEIIAQYNEDEAQMDDPYCADGNILSSDLAKEALAKCPDPKAELDAAAKLITSMMDDLPLDPRAHNWLIRNGYKDESYQAGTYGQELAEVGDD